MKKQQHDKVYLKRGYNLFNSILFFNHISSQEIQSIELYIKIIPIERWHLVPVTAKEVICNMYLA